MLRTLAIRNLAIIDRLDVEFGPGLNVLTGETGAGKSILVGALAAILGGRVDAGMVRGGADRASIDAVFDIAGSPALAAGVAEGGFECEDGELFLSREIAASGKSSARIGGRPATVAQLKEIGDGLVDLHGQHEHQSLLSVPKHLDILDEWGGRSVLALRESVAAEYRLVGRLSEELAGIDHDARERARLIDLYTFQVQEIAQAGLSTGEEDELETEHRRLANAQRLAEASADAASALSGDDGPDATRSVSVALRVLEAVLDADETLQPLVETLRSVSYEIEEAGRDIAQYRDAIEFNPERLAQIDERLDTIRSLKRKYGDTLDEVLAYAGETARKLDALEHGEARSGEVTAELDAARKRLTDLCADLTAARSALAERFAAAVTAELADLAMVKTRFEVAIAPGDPSARGADRVEFVIAPNPGEPMRSLARIASGGEISRVMLALKSALARREPLPTMVFDEIDVGVGGHTATVIGEKLATLAESAQVVCITHLPQIAGYAGLHFRIEKEAASDRTVVRVATVEGEERVAEIARMLGGTASSETVLQHARELLGAGRR